MLAASSLAFLNPNHTIETGGGGLVLGLGGGGLPMAIRALMPHIPVAVCEIEEGLIEGETLSSTHSCFTANRIFNYFKCCLNLFALFIFS